VTHLFKNVCVFFFITQTEVLRHGLADGIFLSYDAVVATFVFVSDILVLSFKTKIIARAGRDILGNYTRKQCDYTYDTDTPLCEAYLKELTLSQPQRGECVLRGVVLYMVVNIWYLNRFIKIFVIKNSQ